MSNFERLTVTVAVVALALIALLFVLTVVSAIIGKFPLIFGVVVVCVFASSVYFGWEYAAKILAWSERKSK